MLQRLPARPGAGHIIAPFTPLVNARCRPPNAANCRFMRRLSGLPWSPIAGPDPTPCYLCRLYSYHTPSILQGLLHRGEKRAEFQAQDTPSGLWSADREGIAAAALHWGLARKQGTELPCPGSFDSAQGRRGAAHLSAGLLALGAAITRCPAVRPPAGHRPAPR